MKKNYAVLSFILCSSFSFIHSMEYNEYKDNLLRKKTDAKEAIKKEKRKKKLSSNSLREVIQSFNKIEVVGNLQVTLQLSDKEEWKIDENENVKRMIQQTVENNTLYLELTNELPRPINFAKVTVFTKVIESIGAANHAQIFGNELAKKCKDLDINVSGKSKVVISSLKNKLEALSITNLGSEIEYVGNVENLIVNMDGDATMKLDASKIVKATISLNDESQCRVRKSEKEFINIKHLNLLINGQGKFSALAQIGEFVGAGQGAAEYLIEGKINKDKFQKAGSYIVTYKGKNNQSPQSSYGSYHDN